MISNRVVTEAILAYEDATPYNDFPSATGMRAAVEAALQQLKAEGWAWLMPGDSEDV